MATSSMRILCASVFLWLAALLIRSTYGCPEMCRCDFHEGRKRVVCEKGGRKEIPTLYMDKDIKVLIITAPPSNPNTLTIGRIFLDFHHLEEVHITHSNLPAIGDSSFWPGKKMRILNLSHNNITYLRDMDFNGLINLQALNLSDNNIATIPSAPFRYLSNLTSLSLARNKLQNLGPRLFFLLHKLEHLDLSGNPLRDIDPDNLKDVKALKTLYLANCKLSRLHSLIYQQLPNIEELDLRDNDFTLFSPEEFRHLRKLKILRLDGNDLSAVVERTFDGHSLEHLGLSRNRIVTVSPCAFCNTSVKELDLSLNRLVNLSPDHFEPLGSSLQVLHLRHNQLVGSAVAHAMKPLRKLKYVSLRGNSLVDLPEETFQNNQELVVLDMSRNKFSNLSVDMFRPLISLKKLDLSENDIVFMYPLLLEQFSNMSALTQLILHSNPWSCSRCHVLNFLDWLETKRFTFPKCNVLNPHVKCMQCAQPPKFVGQDLLTLNEIDLEYCMDPQIQLRVSTAEPQVGLILAVIIIIILVVIIIIIVAIYRRQGAVYYTHEDERHDDGVYDNPAMKGVNGGLGDDKKPPFVATLDRIEEMTEDRSPGRNNMR